MKSIIHLALAIACFIPACGGRTAGDSENGMTSFAGASFDDETGGTSNTSPITPATGGSPAVQTTTTTGGSKGILRLHEPAVREFPGRTVLPGEKDLTVFEFTLSAEHRSIRIPHMYIDVTGSIKQDELMPVTIIDEANNVVAVENPTPYGEIYTFGEYGGAFSFTAFTVDMSAPPKTFRVKTGIEPSATIGKTFRFSIDTSTSLYPTVDDPYEVQTCNLAINGSQFTVIKDPNTSNGTGGSTSVSAGGTSSTGGSTSTGGTSSAGGNSANTPSTNTGGTAGATATTCKPEIKTKILRHSTAIITPGTKNFETLVFQVTALCEDVKIKSMTLPIIAYGADINDTAPYRSANGENFTNAKIINLATGNAVLGPIDPYPFAGGIQSGLYYNRDEFTIPRDSTGTYAVTLDVSDTFTSSSTDTRYSIVLSCVNCCNSCDNLPTQLDPSYAPGFDPIHWPVFTVTTSTNP